MKIILFFIVLIAFALRVYNINYNTAFIDEAQYITVGLKMLNGDWASGIGASSWVGGLPYIYPLLTAFFYSLGGLVGSRLFTAILGTVCVYVMYQFTQQLMFFQNTRMNKIAGLIAASFMAVTAISIITSTIAIYDGLSFTLFFLGIVIFHKAVYFGEKKHYLISALVFFLSFLAKYVVFIFFPLLLVLPVLIALKLKKKKYIKGIILSFCLPLIALTGLYIGLNFGNLQEFFINQGVVSKASEVEVARLFGEYMGSGYVILLLGAPFVWRTGKHLVTLLVFFSFIPLIVHTMTGNISSVQQHTFLSLIFVAPVIGAILAKIISQKARLGILLTLLLIGLQTIISQVQVKEAESFWPNLSKGAEAIRQNIEPSDRVLAESGDSLYLLLKDNIPQEQLEGPFVFSYGGEEGINAYKTAIENGYFNFVQLDGTYFSEDDIQIIKEAVKTKYRISYDDGTTIIYELEN